MRRPVISCFCETLDFSIRFVASIFTLPPLLRCLCLINSFYRRYVSCTYNTSKISNLSPIYQLYLIHWRVTIEIVSPRIKSNCCCSLLFTATNSGGVVLTAFNHYVSDVHEPFQGEERKIIDHEK